MAALGRGGFSAVLAYTTTSGLVFQGQQLRGLHAFDAGQAAAFGHRNAFRLDLKRLAHLSVTPAWFPDLRQPGRGVQGRAPRATCCRTTKGRRVSLAPRAALAGRVTW